MSGPRVIHGVKPTDCAPPELLTIEEAAGVLNFPPASFRKSFKSWGIPFFRVGARCIRIRRSDLEVWLEGRRETPDPPSQPSAEGLRVAP